MLSKYTKGLFAVVLGLCLIPQVGMAYVVAPPALANEEDREVPIPRPGGTSSLGGANLDLARFEAFRDQYDIGVVADLIVPTVVEVPIKDHPETPEFAVLDLDTGAVVADYYRRTFEKEPVPVVVQNEAGERLQSLTDGRYNSRVDFAVEDDRATETVLMFNTATPITSSEIRLGLSKNVALPTSVKLTAGGKAVIAPRRISSATISFPESTATQWVLTLTHTQPLQLTELTLVQDNVEKTVTQGVRFLAQPGHVYRLYADPDRAAYLTTREGGDLRDDEGVVTLASVTKQDNPMYVVADVDEDGTADTVDNCVLVANSDQLDIDGNGRGDACDDFDRDGRINSQDNCPDDPNRRQGDEDGDGIGDECDAEESRFTEKYTWVPWVGLGTAALVILGMFVVMVRREDTVSVEESGSPEDDQTV